MFQNKFYPAKKIDKYKLWIGSKADSMNTEAARRNGIGLVVNCTRDIPFGVPGVAHVRVAIDDHKDDTPIFTSQLNRVVRAIDKHLGRGEGVLVHCYAGISRSASVVAAYLMYKEGLTPRQAMSRVRRVKPETFGDRPNFFKGLEKWNDSLKETRKLSPGPSS
jgi:predicted protein tyrosine phosphatase